MRKKPALLKRFSILRYRINYFNCHDYQIMELENYVQDAYVCSKSDAFLISAVNFF